MARLDRNPYPGNWGWTQGEDTNNYLDRTSKMLEAITTKEKVIRFPVADGRALYVVKSMKPLVLQHVPYGDAYTIPAAHLRGLTVKDVQVMIDREARMAELFGRVGTQ